MGCGYRSGGCGDAASVEGWGPQVDPGPVGSWPEVEVIGRGRGAGKGQCVY